ncbi:MAG: hypothetical protein WBF70_18600 [Aeromonas molluscorum]
MNKLVMSIVLGSLLAGCSHGPVRVHDADIRVDDTRIRVSDGGSGNGSFCPPGQAKKGRC